MPIIPSSYKAKGLFQNGHFSTVYSAKLRPSPKLIQQRERLTLPDGDFLDIDWSYAKTSAKRVAILLHGLEGNAQRTYMKWQAFHLNNNEWDVACVNYRSCSGEPNTKYHSYNAGKTDDLEAVIDFILKKDRHDEIVLIGFSLGGNLLLKYLGERQTIPKEIKKGVAISSPLSLKGSLEQLELHQNWLYRTSFVHGLRGKYRSKMDQHPDLMSKTDLKQIRSLFDFDTIYTAPAHGFENAWDYYDKNSSRQFLSHITRPVLLLNALNDSFLSPQCYPVDLASRSKNIYLETPKHGGHVGFHQTNKRYYSESRTLHFLNDKL